MDAIFVELPAFERFRNNYLNDESFRALQNAMMADPAAGDLIKGTGGLRKLRWTDQRRTRANEAAFGLFITTGYAVENFGYSLSTTKMRWQICRQKKGARLKPYSALN